MTPYALELAKIAKGFAGVPVLREITFSVERGHVLGLVGENGAGKSTLMNLLGGNLQPDSGEMLLHGMRHTPSSPADAAKAGVAFVHQELVLFPNLSIAENIFLSDFPHQKGRPFIAARDLHQRTARLLDEVGLTISPKTRVEQLSTGEGQLVEIAKALSRDAKVILFDEPTTSLSTRETEILFSLIEKLKQRGIGIIYISHVLNDVLRLCDDIVVLRDGILVKKGPRSDFTVPQLVSAMVGRELQQLYPNRQGQRSDVPVLEVSDLGEPHIIRSINLEVNRGEIVGVAGLMGAGRSELVRIIFGLDPSTTGEIRLNGELLGRSRPVRRIERGLAFLTEDRRTDGLCLEASIADNLGLVTWRNYAGGPLRLFNLKRWQSQIGQMGKAVRLNEKLDLQTAVRTLSGGNQQKVVLGKWLLARPSLLILDEPTRGVDVGARFELYQLINKLADEGAGILLISSELEELMGLSDRIVVMNRGTISDRIERSAFDRERILKAALPDQE